LSQDNTAWEHHHQTNRDPPRPYLHCIRLPVATLGVNCV
jgi:hypothetical protein